MFCGGITCCVSIIALTPISKSAKENEALLQWADNLSKATSFFLFSDSIVVM
jgi:hypothetical protein